MVSGEAIILSFKEEAYLLKKQRDYYTAQSVHAHTQTTKHDRRNFHKALFFEAAYLKLGERIELLRKTVSGIMLALLLTSMLTLAFNIQSVKANGTVIAVINPETGNSEFVFPQTTPINQTFLANITITDVENLGGWQLNLTWDPTLLEIAVEDDIYRTPDMIFGATAIEMAKNIGLGKVFWACSRGVGKPTFTGDGILCQINFTILKNDTEGPLTCPMHFDLVSSFPTKITDFYGDPIAFTPQDGSYVIPEFPTTTLLAMFLIITMLAFLFQKKNWLKHR